MEVTKANMRTIHSSCLGLCHDGQEWISSCATVLLEWEARREGRALNEAKFSGIFRMDSAISVGLKSPGQATAR